MICIPMDEDFFPGFFTFGEEVPFTLTHGFTQPPSQQAHSHSNTQVFINHLINVSDVITRPPRPLPGSDFHNPMIRFSEWSAPDPESKQPTNNAPVEVNKQPEEDAAAQEDKIPAWMQIAARDEGVAAAEATATRARI